MSLDISGRTVPDAIFWAETSSKTFRRSRVFLSTGDEDPNLQPPIISMSSTSTYMNVRVYHYEACLILNVPNPGL